MAYAEIDGVKIFYSQKGEGYPVIFLHGNSASGKMFSTIRKHYTSDYTVITFDFPGHGKSTRIAAFPLDFWYENALITIKFIKSLGYEKVNLVGSSGGALVALNVGLEAPELVNKIVADSFEGEHINASWVNQLETERERDKRNLVKRMFWFVNHGNDWRGIVDRDTNMMLRFANEIGMFFHRDLAELTIPTLLIGSSQDEFITDIQTVFETIAKKIEKSEVKIFDKGKHPAILTNAREFSKTAKDFFEKG